MFNLGLICPDSTPKFLGLFDLSVAPSLLFYSYIPIIILSLFFGFYVFLKDSKSLRSKLLLYLSLIFALLLLNEIIQWVGSPVSVVLFGWLLVPLFRVLVPIFTVLFVYEFIGKDKTLSLVKYITGIFILTVIILIPTSLNIEYFDLSNCEGVPGQLWNIVHFFEILSIFWLLFFGIKSFIKNRKDPKERRIIIYLITGAILFLLIFFAASIWGDITTVYEVALAGPIGMLAFIAFLTIMIVRFKAFNIKLIATQALIVSMVVLIGSQFFFIRTFTNQVLTGITLFLSCIGGYMLVRSVKKEVRQREELAKLNIDLENLLKQRQSLVHLVTHKVKGSFTRSKYIFAELLEGTFGPISKKVKDIVQKGLDSDNEGINTVDLVLNVDNLQSGLIKYDMKPLDFKKMAEEIIEAKKEQANQKNLELKSNIKDGGYLVSGDALWLREATQSLVDNALKYTLQGNVTVGLEKKNGKILFSVKDTGVGLTDEDKKHLFTEGGRGKDSLRINVDSTGYGLYSTKMVVEAHKGRVWAESAGKDKGSTFYIELPGQS